MLEKTPGAVLCGHCHALGATEPCRFCKRPVHEECQGSERCPEPRPRELRLGMGWRLRDIDDDGRLAIVGHVLGGEEVRDLVLGSKVSAEWPVPEQHEGLPVTFVGPQAVTPGRTVRCAASYTTEAGEEGDPLMVYRTPLLALSRVEGTGQRGLRFVERPAHELADRLLLSARGGTAVLASGARFDVIDLMAERPVRVVDLRGEMMFDLAFSKETELAVVAVFGHLRCFDLASGQPRGSVRIADEDVSAVALGGRHVALVTEELRLHVLRARGQRPEDWSNFFVTDIEASGRIGRSQLSLSPDGRLVALRQRSKQVLVIDLERDTRQVLRGHTDTVCFVRFIAGGQVLVTADDDNRVRFWPRSGDRIVTGE